MDTVLPRQAVLPRFTASRHPHPRQLLIIVIRRQLLIIVTLRCSPASRVKPRSLVDA
jgi:hypothetical protein